MLDPDLCWHNFEAGSASGFFYFESATLQITVWINTGTLYITESYWGYYKRYQNDPLF